MTNEDELYHFHESTIDITSNLIKMMKCCLCGNKTYSDDENVLLCSLCKQLNRSDLFAKLLATLLDIYLSRKGFDAIKEKCLQLNSIIKNYPLFLIPFFKFDVDEHDTDRTAVHYLRTYVMSQDNHFIQNYHPVKLDVSENNSLYRTFAMLCRLDINDGALELRVRNIIDMVINVDAYHSADPDLHSCLQWGETWQYFVLEQLQEKKSMASPNAVLTLCLASLANILNMKIRSIYPKVPGGSDDLRKRLDHLFVPLDSQSDEDTLTTLNILWSNTKHISSHSTSLMWMPDCVVPLLSKPEISAHDPLGSARGLSIVSQNPAARSFYILSCFCPVTQSVLNELVSASDQQKHSEAEIKKTDTKVTEFSCPKCSKMCNNYSFDWRAVSLFRQNFTGARLTYILIDVTSSMTFNLLQTISIEKKSTLSRIFQTKEAIKQLLKEIANDATPLDQTIVNTFDETIRKPPLIPLSRALEIADPTNLAKIDAIELSPRKVKTYFYSVLKEVYEMFEREPFLHIDFYVFSDGIDTSPRKNDKAFHALIRGLNERIGAKCHFMNCGSSSEGFSVSSWLGDADVDFSINGGINEIQTQVKAIYKRDHARNPQLKSSSTTSTVRFRGKTLDVPLSTATGYMSDQEAASIRKPRQKFTSKDDRSMLNVSSQHSNPDLHNIEDYLNNLPLAVRSRSATATETRSKAPQLFRIITRNLGAKKLGKD